MAVLQETEPRNVFRFFEEICGIPHGSSNTWSISNYLVDFAQKRKLRYTQDKLGNVMIWKPGTPGYENASPVIIQGHMDMVCEKEPESDIDFETDGLCLKLEGNVISAEGTTLGGDDGIAVAYALALLDAEPEEINHPPLEVVITVDEEIGMLGAAAIDCSELTAKIMLNLDSEDEGQLLVSCAGGLTATCHIPVEYESVIDTQGLDSISETVKKLKVTGITGGHSGVEIHKEGANASKILGRLLYCLSKEADIRLVTIQGGLKDNAIPREAWSLIVCRDPDGGKIPDDFVEKYNAILKHEYAATDPDIRVELTGCGTKNSSGQGSLEQYEGTMQCMTAESTRRVIDTLLNLPNGVCRMSKDIAGLVQTSLNLGIMKTIHLKDHVEVQFAFSVRSSVGTEKDALAEQLESLTLAMGGYLTRTGEYPAWEYKQESALREIMVNVYEEQYGHKPTVEAIHAGVECGLFAGKIPGLDCVSFGPRIDDIHTTSERLYVDSVARTWDYLLAVLERIR